MVSGGCRSVVVVGNWWLVVVEYFTELLMINDQGNVERGTQLTKPYVGNRANVFW